MQKHTLRIGDQLMAPRWSKRCAATFGRVGDVAGHALGSKITGAVYRHQIKPSVGRSAQGDGRAFHPCVKRWLAPCLAPTEMTADKGRQL